MTQRTASTFWLALTAAASTLIGLLSVMPGWISHYREMRGEGYRSLSLDLSAWQLGAVPVLATGVVVAVTAGLAVAARTAMHRGGRPTALLPLGAGAGLGLIASAAWPIAHTGQVSGLWLSPGWAVVAGALLAGVVLVGSLKLTRAGPPIVGAAIGLAAIALAIGLGARTAMLVSAESDRPHWSDGTYSRLLDGERRTLTLDAGTYSLDDAWSGRLQSSGLTVVLVEDPACPEARGAYRIFSAGDDDIRWELIVDVCEKGERIGDFVGVWERDD